MLSKINLKKLSLLILAFFLAVVFVGCNNNKNDEILETAKGKILLSSDINNLTNNLDLPTFVQVGEAKIDLSWAVSQNEYVQIGQPDDQGKLQALVTRPAPGQPQASVTLTATLTYEKASTTRSWTVYVKPMPSATVVTCQGAKDSSINDIVEITATVSYVLSQGFMINDNTGGVYVYLKASPDANVKPGAVVKVTGKRDIYNTQPEITSPAVEVVTEAPTTGYDFSQAPEMTISDLINMSPSNVAQYSKIVKVTGQVVKDTASEISIYSLKDTINDKTMYIYNSSTDAFKAELDTFVGKYVSMVAIVYDFHSKLKVWRSVGVEGTIVEVSAPSLDDDTLVNNAISELQSKFDNKSFAFDLNLYTTAANGATINWDSQNKSVYANDGKFTMPSADTNVVLKATVSSNNVSKTIDLTVTAKVVTLQTVKQVTDAVNTADSDFVMVEGIVIGQDGQGYYYLADNSGVIFVRQKLADNGLAVGDSVRVIGKATVYNRSSYFAKQISGNYFVTKLDETKHESPLSVVDVTLNDFDFTITGDNFLTAVPLEDLYGKVIRFTNLYVVNGESDLYLAEASDASGAKIVVYYNSNEMDALKALDGTKVSLIGVVYDYSVSRGWRICFMGREGDVVVDQSMTVAEKLALAKSEIDSIVKEGDSVSANLGFITDSAKTAISGAKYVWTTDDLSAIAADGKFVAPTADKAVKITVQCFLNGDTTGTADASWDINVTAKAPYVFVPTVVISQAYGGGGNTGATLKSDFVELYNTTDHDIDLTGWVLFYASKTGEFKLASEANYGVLVELSGSIKSHGFYLIKLADGDAGTVDLPTADAVGTITMSSSSFKLALCNSGDKPVDQNSANVVDFVGVGSSANLFEGSAPTTTIDNTTAVVRANLTDTNDNATDFSTAAPNPRNSSYVG